MRLYCYTGLYVYTVRVWSQGLSAELTTEEEMEPIDAAQNVVGAGTPPGVLSSSSHHRHVSTLCKPAAPAAVRYGVMPRCCAWAGASDDVCGDVCGDVAGAAFPDDGGDPEQDAEAQDLG